MNKDTLQTIKNLIQLRDQVGHFPDDIDIQRWFSTGINIKILQLLTLHEYSYMNSITAETIDTFTFKNHDILLEEYPDYLRALQMVLEDTRQEDIAEFYLEVDEELPKHVDNSADIEPHEPKQIIRYVEGTNIAYFRPIEKEWEIKEIEQQVLELLEREIQR